MENRWAILLVAVGDKTDSQMLTKSIFPILIFQITKGVNLLLLLNVQSCRQKAPSNFR